jgi:circadian clock protein KaiC
MKSINVDLQKYAEKGLLQLHASRPTLHGLEQHLVAMHKAIKKFKPAAVILDPITNLITIGSVSEVRGMLIRLIDFLMEEQITVMFTALSTNQAGAADEGVSSLVDTWLLVRDIEFNGERNRGLYIMKSRGMKHSNQAREFVISDKGIDLVDVYLGPEGVLTGSAREAQKLLEQTGEVLRSNAQHMKDREIDRKRKVLESKIASLRSEFESAEEELNKTYIEEELIKSVTKKNRDELVRIREGDQGRPHKNHKK